MEKEAMTFSKRTLNNILIGNDESILSYKGPIFKEIIGFIGSYIKNQTDLSKEMKRKVYALFIELIQNVAFYSEEKIEIKNYSKCGIGTLFICRNKQFVEILVGNQILTKDVQALKNRINLLNSMSRKELRQFRLKEINRPFGINDGAHIGMVNIILISGRKIYFDIQKIDEKISFINFKITISSY